MEYQYLDVTIFPKIKEFNDFINNPLVDVNKPDPNGLYLYHYAVINNHPSMVQLLHEKGADINVRSLSGSTPLHFATKEGKLTMVRILIDNGADVTIKDENGNDALMLACKRGCQPIVEYILLKNQQLLKPAYNFCCNQLFTIIMKMFIDYLPSFDLIDSLKHIKLTKWNIHIPYDLKQILDSKTSLNNYNNNLQNNDLNNQNNSEIFEYTINYAPFDIQYCDYAMNSTPELSSPIKVHSYILFTKLPYFSLIPNNSQLPISPETLYALCKWCYTNTIDDLQHTQHPLKNTIEILKLTHPNRLGTITSDACSLIMKLISNSLKEIDVLIEFFSSPLYRERYHDLFEFTIYVLIRHLKYKKHLIQSKNITNKNKLNENNDLFDGEKDDAMEEEQMNLEYDLHQLCEMMDREYLEDIFDLLPQNYIPLPEYHKLPIPQNR